MIDAYADPPYLGSARQYADRHLDALDYNDPLTHKALVMRLLSEFPDGWALSCAMHNLRELLPMCPPSVRVAAWCQPFGGQSSRKAPKRCWEPVIFRGGRERTNDFSPPDFLVTNTAFAAPGHRRANQNTPPRQDTFPGSKPDEFCYWIFELLNMKRDDELVDLFPGTGRVTRAWQRYRAAGTELFSMREEATG